LGSGERKNSHDLNYVTREAVCVWGDRTNCGFEVVLVAGGQYPGLGDFFHQLHYRFFEYNYGNSDVPLDNVSGTFHDGKRAATKKTRKRMKRKRKIRS